MKYILSFGGGVNSTALYFLLQEKGLPLDEIIFADTGGELPETYLHLKRFAAECFPVTIVKREGKKLYDYCFDKKIIPSRLKRDCTSKFKVAPIRKYLRNKYGKEQIFTQYIGIALEEATRMRDSDVKYITNSYPLVDYRLDRDACLSINKKNGFGEVGKSGCFFCPFTSGENWVRLARTLPIKFKEAVVLEENCSRKDLTLYSKRLKYLSNWTTQKGLQEFEPNCTIMGSCFL